MARFKIDENLPAEVATKLTAAGHDALTVSDQKLSGCSDAALADVCRMEGRVEYTDLPVMRVQEPWRGSSVTETPYGR